MRGENKRSASPAVTLAGAHDAFEEIEDSAEFRARPRLVRGLEWAAGCSQHLPLGALCFGDGAFIGRVLVPLHAGFARKNSALISS